MVPDGQDRADNTSLVAGTGFPREGFFACMCNSALDVEDMRRREFECKERERRKWCQAVYAGREKAGRPSIAERSIAD